MKSTSYVQPKKKKKGTKDTPLTVCQYLLKRLNSFGVKHLFSSKHRWLDAIGDYAKNEQKISLIEVPTEEHIGALCSGYSQARGVSCCCLPKEGNAYISTILETSKNYSACVIVLGIDSEPLYQNNELLERALRKETAAWSILDDAKLAAKKIDRVIDFALHYRKPVCLELPEEIAHAPIGDHKPVKTEFPHSDLNTIEDFLLEFESLLQNAIKPCIYQSEMVRAYNVSDEVETFAKRLSIPIVSKKELRELISTDLVIVFGNETPTNFSSVQIGEKESYCLDSHFPNIYCKEVLERLETIEHRKPFRKNKELQVIKNSFSPIQKVLEKVSAKICISQKLQDSISLSNAYLTPFALSFASSMRLANPRSTVVAVVTGDELFSALEALYLSKEHNAPFIVISITTEVIEHSTKSDAWDVSELLHLYLDTNAVQVETIKSFEKALEKALENPKKLSLIEVFV